MVTDIGIEIGNLLDLAFRGREAGIRRARANYNLAKLWMHGGAVASFTSGGVFGVWAYDRLGYAFFLLMAAVLMLVALPGAFRVHAQADARAGS